MSVFPKTRPVGSITTLGLTLLTLACGGSTTAGDDEPGRSESGGNEACAIGQGICGGICLDLTIDPLNCGACGVQCSANERCADGSCVPQCETELFACGADCVDLEASAQHCGGCGNACPSSMACAFGECTVPCAEGLVACDGVCSNLKTSIANCGQCGMACAVGGICIDGECIEPCTQTRCGDECIDPLISNDHCGGCGNACQDPHTCKEGECVFECEAGLTECGLECANLFSSLDHCGGCDNACADEEPCLDAACASNCLGVAFEEGEETIEWIVCSDSVNWETARSRCMSWGYDLAFVDSAEQQAQLAHQMGRLSSTRGYWIGIFTDPFERIPRWVHDDSILDYSNWRSGQPDFQTDAGSPGELGESDSIDLPLGGQTVVIVTEACGAVRMDWNGEWNDYLCRTELSFACGRAG